MPRYSKFHCARSQGTALLLALFSLCSLMPLTTEAARNQEEPLDLAILERQDELTLQMNRGQRLQLVQIEEVLSEARSELRSGQFMINAKPSPMNPDRDLKAIQERGKRRVAEAEATIRENQKALAELLQSVEEAVSASRASIDAGFELNLTTLPYSEALETACRAVMEASWEEKYEALFFHEPFIRDSDGIRIAGPDFRNEIYDMLVDIDGTNFTLTLPADFKLKADTLGDNDAVFAYENASSFERDKKALLVVEMIIPEDSSTGLISVRAIDLATQRIAAAELHKVSDITKFTASDDVEALTDRALDRVKLSGGAENIARVANIPEPYLFELESSTEDGQVELLITHSIFEGSDLLLAGSHFIKEAYGSELTEPENWQGQANGQIVFAEADPENTFELSLQVKGSERTVSTGTATVSAEASEVSE